VPAARFTGFTDTLSVAGALPDAAETASQYALVEAVHSSVPPPVLLIATFCAAGTAPPYVYWNASACGWTPRDAGAAVTVSVTPMDAGVLDAPAAAIEMLPVYVPALKPAGETDTESVDGAVPDAGETLSQFALDAALAVAVQASVPLALFVI
jgi:hypothetical protein